MSPLLIIMQLANLWPGYNLFLIKVYAGLSVGFVPYNVSDLMGNHFYRQTLSSGGGSSAMSLCTLAFLQPNFCDQRSFEATV